jgi:beta-N-acetylhexosaminidase
MQAAGCLACAKHFPGLGRTTKDTHREKPVVGLSRPEMEGMELVPFNRAVAEKAAGIMVCHAVFTALDPLNPASLSPAVVGGLLRGEMEYDGLILTDDLEMAAVSAGRDPAQAAVSAYLAGCDLLLICHHPRFALEALEVLVRMAKEGRLNQKRIQEGLDRVLAAKSKLAPLPGPLAGLTRLLAASA